VASRSKIPEGFDNIHRILGGAMRVVDRALWPVRPHLGGPLPVLSTLAQLDIALVVAAMGRTIADDVAAYDRLVAIATLVRDGTRVVRKNLDDVSRSKKSDDVGTRVAKLAVRTALNHLYAAPSARNTAGTCVENAASALAAYLPLDAAGAFLQTLDDAIVRRELAGLLTERSITPASPLARVVSRPITPGKKSLGLVMAKLDDGRFGLFVKLKQKWEWHEGDRATVFATVPDAFMELVSADLDFVKTRSR
jgi:hypothetical protein